MESKARQGRLPDFWEARFMSCLHIGICDLRNRFRPTRRGRAWIILLLSALGALAPAAEYSADAVRATYLFRFSSYVEWPEAARHGDFIIGVIGDEAVTAHLERVVNGMSVDGRPTKVRRVQQADDLEGVHILYVGERAFRSSRPLRELAIRKPILIVTNSRDGLDGGGVINFVEVNRNLRFDISLDAADRGGLKIDSALLSVAARVEARRGEP
jgi:hypothetical protein